MDPREHHRRVADVFLAALEHADPEARARFVAERCGDDASLRNSVNELLRFHEPSEGVTTAPQPAAPVATNSVVGSYTIHRSLGEGSFGEVYLAERRDEFRKIVALKMLKSGVGTREVLARFQVEKQVLALMDHPNVAGIHDAGTAPDGRPYFVTDYVTGQPITQYADERRMSIEDRLELFRQVCAGVLHAHQKGIIHRDLKPRNILVADVEGKPSPKIIDFGVAKAMDQPLVDGAAFSVTGGLIGTPSYMSPEQWRAKPGDVDTRSDIYALGVLLHELLTGVLPFDTAESYEEMRRLVLETEPRRPSARIAGSEAAAKRRCADATALARRIRGDLDAIVLRCLDTDRGRRYATAADLSADIERHLRHEPILARTHGGLYHLGKYVRRNRQPIAVVAVLLVASVFAVLFYHQQGINRERDAASLLQTARMLAFRYPERAQEVLQRARSLAPRSVDLDVENAHVLVRLGREKEAAEAIDAILRRDPGNSAALAIRSGILREAGDVAGADVAEREARAHLPLDQLHYLAAGLTDDRRAIDLLGDAIAKAPGNANALWQRAERLFAIKRDEDALRDAQVLVHMTNGLPLAWNLQGACRLADGVDRQDDAAVRESVQDFTRAIEEEPDLQLAFLNRSMAHRRLGQHQLALDDVDRAIVLRQSDREAWGQKIGILFESRGEEGAEAGYDEAIRNDPNDWYFHQMRGEFHRRKNRQRDAVADYTTAIEHAPPEELAAIHDRRSTSYRQLGEYEKALADATRAVELKPEWPRANSNMGWALLFLGRTADARDRFARALALEETPTRLVEHGFTAWLMGDPDAAVSRLRKACDAPTFENACLWAWEVELERGDARAASELLLHASSRARAAAEERARFVTALIDVARAGTALSERNALAAARTPAEQAEAHYVIGCARAASGRAAAAQKSFETCANLPVPTSLDRDLARVRLERPPPA